MSPFVRLEVGRARVVPYLARGLGSFVHDQLSRQYLLADDVDNRPAAVRCVHPFVTRFEKLDAMARRYARDEMEADSFVNQRHAAVIACPAARSDTRYPSASSDGRWAVAARLFLAPGGAVR